MFVAVTIESPLTLVKQTIPSVTGEPTPATLAGLIGDVLKQLTATWDKNLVDDLFGELILALVPDLRDVDRRDKHIIQSIQGMAKRLIDEQ